MSGEKEKLLYSEGNLKVSFQEEDKKVIFYFDGLEFPSHLLQSGEKRIFFDCEVEVFNSGKIVIVTIPERLLGVSLPTTDEVNNLPPLNIRSEISAFHGCGYYYLTTQHKKICSSAFVIQDVLVFDFIDKKIVGIETQ